MYLYGEAFSKLRPKERIWGADLADMVLELASDTSFEKATGYMNRFLHRSRENALRKKTVEEFVERTGKNTDSAYARCSDAILSDYGIDTATGIPGTDAKIPAHAIAPSGTATADKDVVEALARRYNEGRDERLRIPKPLMSVLPEGRPDDCIYIYVDDVLTKHQKECRSPGSRRTTRFVATTVISVQHGDSKYNIAADSMQEAFRRLMAFLLANSLMEDRQLIFITDGATEIKEHVQRHFGFRPYTLHLDWHHLQKKCYQLMSSALKGGKKMKQEKDAIERELYSILWTGNVKGALDHITGISQKNIKSQEALDLLKGYINRKQEHIPCYAIRKGLGLHNSSNPVEKANDLIVAHRQKGKGMAWSEEGCHALAAVTVAGINNERYDMLMGMMPRFTFQA
ncbi:MAG: UPF0236 family protein [Bacteroidaceae bacterium]|nr:UPF0236 family protein [Bacteroidaceae bacterium]